MKNLWHNEKLSTLSSKLDLNEHVGRLYSLFARKKSIAIPGDRVQHAKYINALEGIELLVLPELPNMDDLINRLSKEATLSLDLIYLFVKQIEFFNKLKASTLPPVWQKLISQIEIPDEILDITHYFNDEGLIDSSKESELYDIELSLERIKQEQKDKLASILNNSALKDYLVDSQIHLYYGQEALLVRGGFSRAIKANVIGRSHTGFFYIVPNALEKLKQKKSELLDRQQQIYQKYAKKFSLTMHKWWRFLQFLNREFDRVDHYFARAKMLRENDFNLILPDNSKKVILNSFTHPAIKDAVPIDIEFKNRIMLITGVNAGGKTMLLKSILSAALMSKYLIPFKCNPHKSKIGTFEYIETVLDDPQSVKNDISTFAGRIIEFNKLFKLKNALVGVDEIELGTDADEAAALFRVLLEELIKRDIYFVVTTHHKRLASLMANNENVELVAAVYDEKKQQPTYTYLSGSIGKSYAFETALRYGISKELIDRAREYLGKDKENLSKLIEQSTQLEIDMRKKQKEAEIALKKAKEQEKKLLNLKEELKKEYQEKLFKLERGYLSAQAKLKEALKKAENPEARRLINEAYKLKTQTVPKEKEKHIELKIGDSVKYRDKRATVISLKSKEAMIDIDGIKIRVPKSQLKVVEPLKKPKVKKTNITVNISKPQHSKIVLKLLGKRADEAEEEVQNFLSDALLHGFSEVEIIHGTGTGVLSRVVNELLKKHPRVKEFYKVPGNLGATIVKL